MFKNNITTLNFRLSFLGLFLILLFSNCEGNKTPINIETISETKSTLPKPDNNTIALLIPYPKTGMNVAITYDYEIFYKLTNIPSAVLVDWFPNKEWLIYIQNHYGRSDKKNEVWIMKYDGSNKTRISKEGQSCILPRVSPSGKEIMYTEMKNKNGTIISTDIYSSYYTEVLKSGKLPGRDSCNVWGQCWKNDNELVFQYYDNYTHYSGIGIFNIQHSQISCLTAVDSLKPIILKWAPKRDEMAICGIGTEGSQVWAIDRNGKNVRKLSKSFLADAPDWSYNGEKVIFSQLTNGFGDKFTVWVVNRDGTGLKELINKDGFNFSDPVW